METLRGGTGSETLGTRLRGIRLGRALTQGELAGKAGMTPDAISDLEHGKRTPRPKTVRRLAEALDVEIGELTGYRSRSAGNGMG